MFKYIFLFVLFNLAYQRADVYFSEQITPSRIVDLYKKLNVNLKGKIGLKVHTGEANGPYYLRPKFLKEIYEYTKGTFIEANTAYDGTRYTTEKHKETLKINGWLDNGFRTVIMDEDPTKDVIFNLTNAEQISKNYVGMHIQDFDSILVLSHFKGHSWGGFGGALKQLSIGFASKAGKLWIHTGGKSFDDWTIAKQTSQKNFTSAMGDAATTVVNYFKNKGGVAFINTVANISIKCDCAGADAPKPQIKDIGILASTDPVALDKACIDLIRKTNDKGTQDWLGQLERKEGENTIIVAEKHGIGTQEYNLINLDDLDKKKLIFSIVTYVACIVSFLIALGIFIFIKISKKDFNHTVSVEENLNKIEENDE
jgi:uncharacterized Fe-S center protein